MCAVEAAAFAEEVVAEAALVLVAVDEGVENRMYRACLVRSHLDRWTGMKALLLTCTRHDGDGSGCRSSCVIKRHSA